MEDPQSQPSPPRQTFKFKELYKKQLALLLSIHDKSYVALALVSFIMNVTFIFQKNFMRSENQKVHILDQISVMFLYIVYFLLWKHLYDNSQKSEYTFSLKDLLLTTLILTINYQFHIYEDSHKIALAFLYVGLLPSIDNSFQQENEEPKVQLVQQNSDNIDIIIKPSREKELIQFQRAIRLVFVLYFIGEFYFATLSALYFMFKIERKFTQDQMTIKDLNQNIINTKINMSNEVQKWRGLVEKFPQGLIIINKQSCLYSNQMLSQQVQSLTEADAVNTVLNWCVKGEPYDEKSNLQKKNSINVIPSQSHDVTPRSSIEPRKSVSRVDQENRNGIKGRLATFDNYSPILNKIETIQFDNSHQMNHMDIQSNHQEQDFSKTFIQLQQAFSRFSQPIYFSKSAIKKRQSRTNSFVDNTFINNNSFAINLNHINSIFNNSQARKNSNNLESISGTCSNIPNFQIEMKDFEIQTSMIQWGDEDTILLVVKDITDTKNFSKLKLQNKYKSMGLCTLSHELRTPVHVILNSLHNIKEWIDVQNTQLLMYHKISTSSAIILLHKIDDFLITSDPNRIKQILFNLIQNGIKFTPKGYIKIFIYYETIKINNITRNYVSIEVEDTGIGIRRQEIPYLYELFGINKLNKEKKNVGLGLSISYLLSKRLGKALVVDSVYGQGTIMGFKVKSKTHDQVIQGFPNNNPLDMSQIEEDKSEESEGLTPQEQFKRFSSDKKGRRQSQGYSHFREYQQDVINHRPLGNINSDIQPEYSCILFESIRNDKIQEKVIFLNIRKIKVMKKIQANPNQDLSRLMKEYFSMLQNDIQDTFLSQILQNAQEGGQGSGQNKNRNMNNSEKFTLSKINKQQSKVSTLYQPKGLAQKKGFNRDDSLEVSKDLDSSLCPENQAENNSNKMRHQRSRSLLPTKREKKQVNDNEIQLDSFVNFKYEKKLTQVKKNKRSQFHDDSKTANLRFESQDKDFLNSEFGSSKKIVRSSDNRKAQNQSIKIKGARNIRNQIKNLQARSKKSNKNLLTRIDHKLIRDQIITNKGILGSNKMDFHSVMALKEQYMNNFPSSITPNFMAQQQLVNHSFNSRKIKSQLLEENKEPDSLPYFNQRDQQIKVTPLVVQTPTETDQCITEFNEEEKDNRFKNFGIFDNKPIEDSSFNQLRKLNWKLQAFDTLFFNVNQDQPDPQQIQQMQMPIIITPAAEESNVDPSSYTINGQSQSMQETKKQLNANSSSDQSNLNMLNSGFQAMSAPKTQKQTLQIQAAQIQDAQIKIEESNDSIRQQSLSPSYNPMLTGQLQNSLNTLQVKLPFKREDLENLQKQQMKDLITNFAVRIREERQKCECPSILIVEDDEFIKIITKTMLMSVKFQVHDVGNGQLAVDAVDEQEQKCDKCRGFLIILMDYDMPVMNGVEATKKIKTLAEEGKIKDIPIIAVSAFVASQEIDRCLNSGMSDYISKPFTQQRLFNVLMRWMPIKLTNDIEEEDDDDEFDDELDDEDDSNN
eukprot:403377173